MKVASDLDSATINFFYITLFLAQIFDDIDPDEPLERDNLDEDLESEDLEPLSFLSSFSPSFHQL